MHHHRRLHPHDDLTGPAQALLLHPASFVPRPSTPTASMRATIMLSDAPLRRPRALFAIGIIILCITLVLFYERIRHSDLSFFEEPVPASTEDLGIPTSNVVPLTDQEKEDYRSIFDNIRPMSYGTAARPPIKGMPDRMIDDLPEKYIPATAAAEAAGQAGARRLIFVGDVHGHKKALDDLLATLRFDNRKGDHLIFTGDLINKGPDSAGVVALAMELGAHSVRGNHEDRVLLTRAALDKEKERKEKKKNKKTSRAASDVDDTATALETFQIKDGDTADPEGAMAAYQAAEASLSKGDQRARETAESLSQEQIEWLSALPLVLRVGSIPLGGSPSSSSSSSDGAATLENVLVCHAGLVPGLPLEDQDPWAVMNMRTLSYPVDELRRDAVREFLLEKAKAGGNRGALAKTQKVDEAMVDGELARIVAARGLDDREGDVAVPSSGRDGAHWYEKWSRLQEKLGKERAKKERKEEKQDKKKGKKGSKGDSDGEGEEEVSQPLVTVVYGHDAKSGLQVPKEYGKGKRGYTFGLDSGCVYGKKLSALVVEVKKGDAVWEIVQVECENVAEE